MASVWEAEEGDDDPADLFLATRDLPTQAVISVLLGLSAFLTFCFLRPRWTSLYAARRKQKSAASKLPQLPSTLFGWIPVLYSITEDEILATAGLDAFVFLRFFKVSIKYLAFVLFFSLTAIYPVHKNFGNLAVGGSGPDGKNGTDSGNQSLLLERYESSDWMDTSTGYLWIYVVFVYLFSGAALYLIFTETKKVIQVRQKHLGAQSSISDRTIRLSGIPAHLRSETKIKETVENLQIGKVESVTLCRNWRELDNLVEERIRILKKLESALIDHQGPQTSHSRLTLGPLRHRVPRNEDEDDDEQTGLLENGENEQDHVTPVSGPRPTTRFWYGFLGLQNRKVDAIDYYEERLKVLDGRIEAARRKEYTPMPLAFVTLDSIAACQMATQAILDPEPMQLMVNVAPAPADVVWRNTYLSRRERMLRAWSITFVVLVLTVLWISILFPFGALLNLKTTGRFLPGLAEFLKDHKVIQSLVRTSLPTVGMSILNTLVPYLYDWLSNKQGMTSQADVEMSVISKNFFFTFFTLFVAFTVIGVASTAYQLGEFMDKIRERFGDVFGVSQVIAESLGTLGPFYMNLIILQGLGLFPFRLLEFGTVFMYPFGLIGSKTPRDYAELVQPPVFSYGFYLPQSLFVLTICIVYSILPNSELVLIFGLIYFIIGSFIYKYQLLYAMDHRNFSTGRAWPMICIRILVGLMIFQFAMAGQLALRGAIRRSILIAPLLIGTIWFTFFYRKTFEPLMRFIALRSLHEAQDEAASLSESRYEEETHGTRVAAHEDESGYKFVNPSLVVKLGDAWLPKSRSRGMSHGANGID